MYIVKLYTGEDGEKTLEDIITKGFFIAPLFTLMITNQKAIVNHFITIFIFNKKAKTKKLNKKLDKDGISHKKDKEIRKLMIKIIYYPETLNPTLNNYIDFTRTIIKSSVNIRDGNEYRNTAVLVISGTSLIVGYFLLIFKNQQLSLSFLIFSLILVFFRELLALRSIIKRSIFYDFLRTLKKELKKEERNTDRRRRVFE